jgi:hypothetical protein
MSYQRELAEVYWKLLTKLDWSDELLLAGIREGRNKFLSNAFLQMCQTRSKKHLCTHFISSAALELVDVDSDAEPKGLKFEHVVPKKKYLQEPCEKLAGKGRLTVEFIEDRLTRYWWLATITTEEDKRLLRDRMPDDWDEVDVFARYRLANLSLDENRHFTGPPSERVSQPLP